VIYRLESSFGDIVEGLSSLALSIALLRLNKRRVLSAAIALRNDRFVSGYRTCRLLKRTNKSASTTPNEKGHLQD